MDWLTAGTIDVANKALDGLAMRHSAIASNLANVDTPGYARKEVVFEQALHHAIQTMRQDKDALQSQASNDTPLAMRTSSYAHFAINKLPDSLAEVTPESVEIQGSLFRNDGNSVDVETEMVKLAQNTERYMALANLEGRMVNNLQGVIRGSGEV